MELDWSNFKSFLLQHMNKKTAYERVRYAKKFYGVLLPYSSSSSLSGNKKLPSSYDKAQSLLALNPNKRIHVMKALASLARFTGRYDQWMEIRKRYNLKWSTGSETLNAFTRFFDDNSSLDSMLKWVKQAISILPDKDLSAAITFDTLTGLRASEALQAIRLIKNPETFRYTIMKLMEPLNISGFQKCSFAGLNLHTSLWWIDK